MRQICAGRDRLEIWKEDSRTIFLSMNIHSCRLTVLVSRNTWNMPTLCDRWETEYYADY